MSGDDSAAAASQAVGASRASPSASDPLSPSAVSSFAASGRSVAVPFLICTGFKTLV